MTGVTVVLADDHPVFRDGPVQLLERGGVVAGRRGGRAWRSTRSASTARRWPSSTSSCLDIDGETVIDIVRREHLPTRILVLSARTDSAVVYRCIELGAAGYLPKLTAGDDICAAVGALARGESVVPAELQAGLASEIRMRRADDRPCSRRAADIIRLAADGTQRRDGLRCTSASRP
jgi:two-component system nitrate/nitrite response regulator NarL